jgi:hypothetical protein
MLRPVSVVEQWREIQDGLPEDWADARLRLTIQDAELAARAAALLGPINPGRRGNVLRFYAARRGTGQSPGLVERLLARLDEERIPGQLELVGTDEAELAPPQVERPTLAGTWDASVAALPPDWSDLYCEVELVSSDWLDRAALLMAPVNPARFGGVPGFRMTRRCLERVDQEHIRGELRILRVLSDTNPVHTQGPVWYVEGRSV